ncbi:MAG: HD domain-containing protein, partial [Desulfovibrionaceae bacterium]
APPHPAGENLLDGPGGPRFASQSAAGAGHALGIFTAMAHTGRPLAWSAWRFIHARSRAWGADLAADPALPEALLAAARAPHAEAALEAWMETGLLGAAVPEFGRVQHLVQFDDVHLHPVGPHTLKVMTVLASFLAGEGGWAADIARRLSRPRRLLLAAFFHDLGKESPGHAAVGADLARAVLARFGADPAEAEEVAFLVREHLRIPATATGEDLGDESVVARVAAACGTPERLDALYLLSVADSLATGPRSYNDWIASLFAELYFKARNLLEQGDLAEPDAAGALAARLEAVGLLAERRFGPDAARQCLDRLPARMAQALPPEDVVAAYGLVRRTEEALALDAVRRPGRVAGLGVCEVEVRRSRAAGFLELTLAARDRPGLFAAVVGVLTLQNLDICSAEVFTWKGGLALDVFTVSEPRDREFADEFWGRVRAMLGGALTGRLDVAHHLAQRRASPLAAGRCGPKLPAEVRVDNAVSDFYTKVSVAAPDRVGLLHDLAARLTELGADIQLARIATRSGLVADVFYVRGADGRKITDQAAVAGLEQGLLEAACG